MRSGLWTPVDLMVKILQDISVEILRGAKNAWLRMTFFVTL